MGHETIVSIPVASLDASSAPIPESSAGGSPQTLFLPTQRVLALPGRPSPSWEEYTFRHRGPVNRGPGGPLPQPSQLADPAPPITGSPNRSWSRNHDHDPPSGVESHAPSNPPSGVGSQAPSNPPSGVGSQAPSASSRAPDSSPGRGLPASPSAVPRELRQLLPAQQ